MLPQRILLCMLLSAVTAGNSLHSKACAAAAAAERSQVHFQSVNKSFCCHTAVSSKLQAYFCAVPFLAMSAACVRLGLSNGMERMDRVLHQKLLESCVTIYVKAPK